MDCYFKDKQGVLAATN